MNKEEQENWILSMNPIKENIDDIEKSDYADDFEKVGNYNGFNDGAHTVLENLGELLWHHYPEEKPNKPGRYLTWISEDLQMTLRYDSGFTNWDSDVKAWMEIPLYNI